MLATAEQIEVKVRSVTDDELAFYAENGWVKLPGLLRPDLAVALRERAEQLMGVDAATHTHRATDMKMAQQLHYMDVRRSDGLYDAVVTTNVLGRNAARLLGRNSSIRLFANSLAVKPPAGTTAYEHDYARPTQFHQDLRMPFDQGQLTFWIALDEITPEQGPLQFYTGSHKLGFLGRPPTGESYWTPELRPQLADCSISEPEHFHPGDATAHGLLTAHGAGGNLTDRPRWVLICVCFPADALYLGGSVPSLSAIGLEPGKPADHPNFPVIYEAAA